MPTACKSDLHLSCLTSPEAARALADAEMVLIPVGTHEQHGPNLAMQSDAALAEAVAVRVAEQMRPRLLVAPAIPWGISGHHMGFPGTIALQTTTLEAVLRDVVWSLRQHGTRNFLFVNGHGGNEAALATVALNLKRTLDVDFIAAAHYYRFPDRNELARRLGSTHYGHACEMETAWAMELRPDIVRRGELVKGELHTPVVELRQWAASFNIALPLPWEQLTVNGPVGDATKASPELGRELTDQSVAGLVKLIERVLAPEMRQVWSARFVA
jgi:creatinine amidohydrolase